MDRAVHHLRPRVSHRRLALLRLRLGWARYLLFRLGRPSAALGRALAPLCAHQQRLRQRALPQRDREPRRPQPQSERRKSEPLQRRASRRALLECGGGQRRTRERARRRASQPAGEQPGGPAEYQHQRHAHPGFPRSRRRRREHDHGGTRAPGARRTAQTRRTSKAARAATGTTAGKAGSASPGAPGPAACCPAEHGLRHRAPNIQSLPEQPAGTVQPSGPGQPSCACAGAAVGRREAAMTMAQVCITKGSVPSRRKDPMIERNEVMKRHQPVNSGLRAARNLLVTALALAAAALAVSPASWAQSGTAPHAAKKAAETKPAVRQKLFSTPEEAKDALVAAGIAKDETAMAEIFG